ncbi:E3 ubiquitin-protein ligase [Acrasis kona]|uniref:E3 ubiquitin-protein ligase n=1 Tax=Acrasis kona TaxID=1008807 RepID=A0AAW2Z814_9EUKA
MRHGVVLVLFFTVLLFHTSESLGIGRPTRPTTTITPTTTVAPTTTVVPTTTAAPTTTVATTTSTPTTTQPTTNAVTTTKTPTTTQAAQSTLSQTTTVTPTTSNPVTQSPTPNSAGLGKISDEEPSITIVPTELGPSGRRSYTQTRTSSQEAVTESYGIYGYKIWMPIVIVLCVIFLLLLLLLLCLFIARRYKRYTVKKERELQNLSRVKTIPKPIILLPPPAEPSIFASPRIKVLPPVPVAATSTAPTLVVPNPINDRLSIQTTSTIQSDISANQVDVLCPMTGELFSDPVILVSTGKTYERSAIEKWLSTHHTDPMTGEFLHNKEIRNDMAMRGHVRQWLESE